MKLELTNKTTIEISCNYIIMEYILLVLVYQEKAQEKNLDNMIAVQNQTKTYIIIRETS
jgi:hypothetical protein